MSGCYVYMHGEKTFFDVDAEVDTVAKVVQALNEARSGTRDELADAVYKAISELESVALVETHIEHLENITSCASCGHEDDRREMTRFYRAEKHIYACDEDCMQKVLTASVDKT